jgi:hypothetical protein
LRVEIPAYAVISTVPSIATYHSPIDPSEATLRSLRSHSSPFRSWSSPPTKPPETLPALPETLPKSPHECSEATCDPSEVTRHSREVTSHAGEAARRPLRSHSSPLRSHPRPARSGSATLPKPPTTAPKSSEMTADSVATTAKLLNDDPRLGQSKQPSHSSRLTTHPSRLPTWSATTADPLQTSPGPPATAHRIGPDKRRPARDPCRLGGQSFRSAVTCRQEERRQPVAQSKIENREFKSQARASVFHLDFRAVRVVCSPSAMVPGQ